MSPTTNSGRGDMLFLLRFLLLFRILIKSPTTVVGFIVFAPFLIIFFSGSFLFPFTLSARDLGRFSMNRYETSHKNQSSYVDYCFTFEILKLAAILE